MGKRGPKRLLTDEEALELCDEILQFLIDNPTTYNWRTKFLISRRLSENYLYKFANKVPEVKELYKMINFVVNENVDNCVRAGTIQYGYGNQLHKIFRNPFWNTPKELLEVEKLKTEINNISKSSDLIDSQIVINLTEASHRSDEDIERLLNE